MTSGVFSPDLIHWLERRIDDNVIQQPRDPGRRNPITAPERSIFGMPVRSSPVFPYDAPCKTCGGTGEGSDSTFCPDCKGAGATRYQGMMQTGRQTTLLTEALPRRFEPRPPSVPPAPMRGLI